MSPLQQLLGYTEAAGDGRRHASSADRSAVYFSDWSEHSQAAPVPCVVNDQPFHLIDVPFHVVGGPGDSEIRAVDADRLFRLGDRDVIRRGICIHLDSFGYGSFRGCPPPCDRGSEWWTIAHELA